MDGKYFPSNKLPEGLCRYVSIIIDVFHLLQFMKEGHWTVTFQRNPSWPTVRITRAEAINGPDFTIELTNLGSVLHNLRNREQLFPCKFHHCTSAIELDSTQNSVHMASIIRSKSVLSVFFINLFLSLVSSAVAVSSGSGDGFSISGRVKLPGMSLKAFGSPGGKASNVKVVLNGGEHVTFLRPDGYFSFQNMSAGTHLIEVAAIGYFFSPVRVDVSARHPGKVQAALTETRRGLNELVLEPLREEQYYEIREPFSIMSLVKSPMGLMMGFMLVVVFLMPKLMENMDPEEMRRAQEEMRSQGVPSLANLIPGAGRS